MNATFVSTAAIATAPSVAPSPQPTNGADALIATADRLLTQFERGVAIDARALRAAMIASFGAPDAEGAWDWKTACEACEAAQILFLRKFGPAMRDRAASSSRFLGMLTKLAALVPSHTRRSEESQALQQFSTPIALGFVASTAAATTPIGPVLEPSAGAGLLAVHAELEGARLVLNELANTRSDLLDRLFPGARVTQYDAAHINDYLDRSLRYHDFATARRSRLDEGILFTTYATLRSDAREEKVSCVRQIVDWLGCDFDGVIVFDESHAMQNAAGAKGERGKQAPSQQGREGLRLQHALPDARIVYVSATGAITVHNLAYAQRLGLWGRADFPFATRAEFVEAIEAGGVAAMEVLARDLKALGLYAARSLSYEGIEYELVEHRLTPADSFAAVHDGRTILHLQDGLDVRRGKIMGDFRIEVSGFSDGTVERLKAMGFVSKIIAWKLCLFVPAGADGPAILGALMERHPLVRLVERSTG